MRRSLQTVYVILIEKKVYLIVVGGDGTLNEVLNGMHDFEKSGLDTYRPAPGMISQEV